MPLSAHIYLNLLTAQLASVPHSPPTTQTPLLTTHHSTTHHSPTMTPFRILTFITTLPPAEKNRVHIESVFSTKGDWDVEITHPFRDTGRLPAGVRGPGFHAGGRCQGYARPAAPTQTEGGRLFDPWS